MTEPGTPGINEERLESSKPVDIILKEISGHAIEQKLVELAKIGGNVKEVGKDVAVSRLALSKEDLQARAFLETQMEKIFGAEYFAVLQAKAKEVSDAAKNIAPAVAPDASNVSEK